MLNSSEVAAVLATTHIRFLAPKIDRLGTIDGGHLNSRSAELWSAAFLEALTPIVNECLGQLAGSRDNLEMCYAAPRETATGALWKSWRRE